MDEKVFVSETDFFNQIESLGFTRQNQLSGEQITDWYTQFVSPNRDGLDPGLIDLSRQILTKREKMLGFATSFFSSIIFSGYGTGATQLPPDIHAKIGEMFPPYNSATSIFASTAIMGISTITGEALGAFAQKNDKNNLAKGLRLTMPAIGAITSAVYQYMAEFQWSGYFSYGDVVFGVLAVGTGYIGMRALGNGIPEKLFRIKLKKHISDFINEKLSIEDVIVEPELAVNPGK
ncbi:MAG: hypothetical protein E6R05_00985 [Candidatus Moraniibacteriota bacterium]|nr:MAG: hypothetical protein E6R05_00985 [Candidatus Moranbacteria bacterium]